ncbi:thioesterase II family protein [Streptomyces sp. NPDC048208]|uniref:thioesterase II family protein n=1 Tax=Streptomyces sp. NPDC048208 TaxID=3365515 RepID=UPI00371832D0
MATLVDGSDWFRVLKPAGASPLRLLCFPHAGGSASFFHPWSRFVPDGVELVAARYPGREERILDSSATSMGQLVEDLAHACEVFKGSELILFGHSMGASVAHELALTLQDRDVDLRGLIVSGRAGPQDQCTRDVRAMSDAELIEEICGFGGTDPLAFQSEELRELFLPPVRADYELLRAYVPTMDDRLSVPVIAYYGDQDPDLSSEAVGSWESVTRSSFTMRGFPGGHFYVSEHASAVLRDAFSRLSSVAGVGVRI